MWCLETIIEVNNKLAEGKPLDEAYAECGITLASRKVKKLRPEDSGEQSQWEMQKPPMRAAS